MLATKHWSMLFPSLTLNTLSVFIRAIHICQKTIGLTADKLIASLNKFDTYAKNDS